MINPHRHLMKDKDTVRWSVDDDGKPITIGWPICGQRIRVNGESRVVVHLNTYYAVIPMPKPTAKEMVVGDSWESAEEEYDENTK